MGIAAENISKGFGNFQAVDRVNLEIAQGSLIALLGPSGSGKSTLLRLISGLETPDEGRLWLAGKDATTQSVRERNIGFVFQNYALFKHLTIGQNIAFGLEIRSISASKVKKKVAELLDLIQLSGLGNRYPAQLSGGQRQRVALARALAIEPKILLLDEPFGALDARVRKDLRAWLRQLHERSRVTTVFVTHDRSDAMEVADKIVIMNKGRIEQIGTPAEIYNRPANAFVMGFVGPVNILPSSANIFQCHNFAPTNSEIFIRPQDIAIETGSSSNTVAAKVQRLTHLGSEVQAELALADGQLITAHLSREHFDKLQLEPQQQVFVKPKAAKTFPVDFSI
ncbi:sulfate/molybdate ABC transporter ATP-binding protein [Chamaesiphon minutus]|uniref:ABC-type quaternary amine transporter n=1 Tax=Chamaesiphon minutus (strain ATCC 27169 / PCC 6605) TaxID=1173020 RepID=K9U985_CHAP6|nr:TOBE-like domain-containing protein [Chamaesiphon minutus]AFY91375.1 sulfate ABC transporter, ATP-binding protein [Chamaesiphon minutus PCC 6605]